MKAILSPGRKGYLGGIKSGLSLVSADYVLFVDSDGQHAPPDFFNLWSRRAPHTVVSGWRVTRSDSAFRRMMSGAFRTLVRLVFRLPKLNDITAPLRLVNTSDAKAVMSRCRYMKESLWTEFTVRALALGLRIVEVPVYHRQRPSGSTRVYKLRRLPAIIISQSWGLLRLFHELSSQKRAGR